MHGHAQTVNPKAIQNISKNVIQPVMNSGTKRQLEVCTGQGCMSGASMSKLVMAEPSQIELVTGSAQGALVPPGTNQHKAGPIFQPVPTTCGQSVRSHQPPSHASDSDNKEACIMIHRSVIEHHLHASP